MLLKQVVANTSAKEKLIQGVLNNRISHAQLFLGAEGSGALPLAIAYIQYVFCTNKQEEDSCGTCLSCIKINKLAHPDLYFVFPVITSKDAEISDDLLPEFREAIKENPYMSLFDWYTFLGAENKQGNISTKESDSIIKKLSLTTYESEYKAMIIWMAEKMNVAAANKILKILEEPPDKTLFILISENEDDLLRTIISRTQVTKIKLQSTQQIADALQAQENLTPEKALSIAYLANGNYSFAKQLLKQETENSNFTLFKDLMRASFAFDVAKIVAWVDVISKSDIGREGQKNFLLYALQMIRDCFLLNNNTQQLVQLPTEEEEFIAKFSPFIKNNNGAKLIEEINLAYSHIERNANPKILFTDLAFKFNEHLKAK